MEKLSGTWDIISIEHNGRKTPAQVLSASKVVFQNDRFTFKVGDLSTMSGRYDMVQGEQSITLLPATGQKKGERLLGIIELAGDSLKLCYSENDLRPRDFTTSTGSGRVLLVLKRENR